MSAVTPSSVLVLGSGVIGLTVAYTLVHDYGYDGASILIIARDMPGDLDSQAFASPWAGANWSPIGGAKEPKMYEWERYTYNKFLSMESTGQVKVMRSRNYYENASAREDVWYRNLVQNYKELTDAELPAGLGFCTEYDTVSVNPALYLPWLQENLSQKGVKFMRQKIHCLDDVRVHMNPDAVVINATSLGGPMPDDGSRSIIGIEDSKLYPIRGQTITVNAPDIKLCCAIADKDLGPRGAITYIIPRPSPSGSVLLGGTYQVGNWDTSIDLDTAASILEQCGKLEPSLLDAASSARVISHNVGLRPAREGGPRVERQVVNLPIKNTLRGPQQSGDEAGVMRLVHAYGFGGVGYQNSWGVAQEVAGLISGPW